MQSMTRQTGYTVEDDCDQVHLTDDLGDAYRYAQGLRRRGRGNVKIFHEGKYLPDADIEKQLIYEDFRDA